MMKVERFEDLTIWKEARQLSLLVYRVTEIDPFSKDFALEGQIRRSSGSLIDNIAEGFERGGNKELRQFLSIAKGSCGEVRSQCFRARDLNYLDEETFTKITTFSITLSKQIASFISYLSKSPYKGIKYK
ncbi:MAG: four helix bundle protein [Candidatus Marinimicrobia bacterium]|nr:four helix bundle protein [Candidatus Neomarinimicrobiota bacterium]